MSFSSQVSVKVPQVSNESFLICREKTRKISRFDFSTEQKLLQRDDPCLQHIKYRPSFMSSYQTRIRYNIYTVLSNQNKV